jgi:hypothetical protein
MVKAICTATISGIVKGISDVTNVGIESLSIIDGNGRMNVSMAWHG